MSTFVKNLIIYKGLFGSATTTPGGNNDILVKVTMNTEVAQVGSILTIELPSGWLSAGVQFYIDKGQGFEEIPDATGHTYVLTASEIPPNSSIKYNITAAVNGLTITSSAITI